MTGGSDKFVELLRRAGLDIVGDRRTEEVLPPRAAWRPVIAFEAEPAVAVQIDRPDLVAELNTQWHRLAVKEGIIGEDGVFLIDVAGNGTGCVPRGWTRVRLTARWNLAGVLGERPGQPEFLTLSTDGNTLLGATTEEDEVWLVTVDRIKERQEAAARTKAQETPEERAAAWASLLQGPCPPGRLRELWAHGLALNPSTPEDVRARLLGLSHFLLWRRLPTAVVEAAMVHPEWKVRELLAEAQPNITAEQWARLILGEEHPRRRWVLTLLAADRRAELTEAVHEQLSADSYAPVREETVRLPGLPPRTVTALAADPDPAVRAMVCARAWARLEIPVRRNLLGDLHGTVRAEAILQHHKDHPLPPSVFDSEDLKDRAVETCRLERELAENLAHHGTPAQRCALAGNPHLERDLVALLARDPDENVRSVVATRPDLTEEQRSGIQIDFDPRGHHSALRWVTALHDDTDAMRRLAASSHPLVRRSVARAKHLPPDVIERLAQDEDRVVQLFLAESCDDAPAEMLLRVWQWWTGSLSTPDRPRGHPNFPRHGLLRYAGDPNPRMRQLALDDPESTPELVERFSRDTEAEVRLRAANDPRLTPASAVRMLDDPHEHIRHAAARHPRLPARVLVQLLRDTDTAQTAARHPSLPVAVMEQMIQRLQPPTSGIPSP
ncbi:PE-PGRS family protein [Streptomyces nigrescens]|uniref:PE-PGRS family protein n=1 Tax=Streptomyces nigrescens TaxID=1920 RepID=A0ABY7IW98_STRNI|nr:PE-PGRS family protein [Streptomyces nigrescens]WAU02367.1 PE-PGRS family protein [Streptomyces nigrescens]